LILPARLVFFGKADQFADIYFFSTIQTYSPGISTKHLVDFTEDDAEFGAGWGYYWTTLYYVDGLLTVRVRFSRRPCSLLVAWAVSKSLSGKLIPGIGCISGSNHRRMSSSNWG
jgi:hypothetical protein